MKVLFLKHAPPYHAGEVADVATGYAQNFLFPKKLAILATADVVASAKQQHERATQQTQKDESAAREALQTLGGKHIRIPNESSPSGTLYAALQPKHIYETLQQHVGGKLPHALLEQLPNIKHKGSYTVVLQYRGQSVTFTLDV